MSSHHLRHPYLCVMHTDDRRDFPPSASDNTAFSHGRIRQSWPAHLCHLSLSAQLGEHASKALIHTAVRFASFFSLPVGRS
jgi:hypothetical protein